MKRKFMWSLLLLFCLGVAGCESYILDGDESVGAVETAVAEPAGAAMDEEMLALAAEWMALEKLEGRQVLAKVDEQINQMESMRIDYVVATDYGPASMLPNTRSTFKVSYIRQGERYHLHELNRSGNQAVLEARTIYDGEQLVQYENTPDDQNPHQGQVTTGEKKTKIGSVNDFLKLAGLQLGSRLPEDWVVNNLGFDKLGMIDVLKIQMVQPSKLGEKLYTYLWIKPQQDSYQLLQVQGLIDDDPEKLIFEVANTYRAALNIYLPWLIRADRYAMDAEGKMELDFRARVMVEELDIGGVVEDSELVFELPEGTVIRQEE